MASALSDTASTSNFTSQSAYRSPPRPSKNSSPPQSSYSDIAKELSANQGSQRRSLVGYTGPASSENPKRLYETSSKSLEKIAKRLSKAISLEKASSNDAVFRKDKTREAAAQASKAEKMQLRERFRSRRSEIEKARSELAREMKEHSKLEAELAKTLKTLQSHEEERGKVKRDIFDMRGQLGAAREAHSKLHVKAKLAHTEHFKLNLQRANIDHSIVMTESKLSREEEFTSKSQEELQMLVTQKEQIESECVQAQLELDRLHSQVENAESRRLQVKQMCAAYRNSKINGEDELGKCVFEAKQFKAGCGMVAREIKAYKATHELKVKGNEQLKDRIAKMTTRCDSLHDYLSEALHESLVSHIKVDAPGEQMVKFEEEEDSSKEILFQRPREHPPSSVGSSRSSRSGASSRSSSRSSASLTGVSEFT